MARKEKKYHFVYKTTNLLSGKYYIGIHSTDDLEDGYFGSGRRLRYSLKKYGKENHKREILKLCDTRQELYILEKDIVNLNEIAKEECMNMCVGGIAAGFISEEHMKKCSKAGNDAFLYRFHNDEVFRKKLSEETSETNKRLINEGKLKVPNYNWSGKKHSDETKEKISESKKGVGIGKNNSQYGTCWITRDGVNKKIEIKDLHQWIKEGWKKGRKC